MILSIAALLGALAPEPVAAPVTAVTVHPDRARVTRRTRALTSDGAYTLTGLTGALDPDSLRARVAGGHVLSVELRRRVTAEPESERLYFAGEATIREYEGTVHGAWLSGLREAERLLAL